MNKTQIKLRLNILLGKRGDRFLKKCNVLETRLFVRPTKFERQR